MKITAIKQANIHFSSKTDQWETPQDFFDRINRIYKLEIDICADENNRKLERFWNERTDALTKDWTGIRGWMNPPYGRQIGKWVEKAATGGADIIVALLPARTDTKWFHDFIYKKAEVKFLKGRLKFGGHKNSAPFPSMLVVFMQ